MKNCEILDICMVAETGRKGRGGHSERGKRDGRLGTCHVRYPLWCCGAGGSFCPLPKAKMKEGVKSEGVRMHSPSSTPTLSSKV
jgi:hypothetical protein